MSEQLKLPIWRVRWSLFAPLLLISLLPGGFITWWYFLHDRGNIPLCNKQTMGDVENWFHSKERMDLPNVGGRSADSLVQLKRDAYELDNFKEEIQKWNGKYQYIPGLRRNDPGDLVLMYMKKPTRWQHHAAGPPSIFRERKWIVVSLDFAGFLGSDMVNRVNREMPDESENAERVTLKEFKSRLRKTLDYLQTNNRPNWQTVVAENEAFLNSIEN
jgi:hypothetical protein